MHLLWVRSSGSYTFLKRLAPTMEWTWPPIYIRAQQRRGARYARAHSVRTRSLTKLKAQVDRAGRTSFGLMIESRRVVTMGWVPPKIQCSAWAVATSAATERSLENENIVRVRTGSVQRRIVWRSDKRESGRRVASERRGGREGGGEGKRRRQGDGLARRNGAVEGIEGGTCIFQVFLYLRGGGVTRLDMAWLSAQLEARISEPG